MDITDEFCAKINSAFSISRVFAVLSVICAHVIVTSPPLLNKIFDDAGSIGVIVFFMLAGYYFHSEKYGSVFAFLHTKVTSIVIPWFICGFLVYIYSCILKRQGIHINEMVPFILGYKTLYYYMSVLLMCYLLLFCRKKVILYLAIAANILSVFLTVEGLLDTAYTALHITKYLNVFNWIGFFAAGILLQSCSADLLYKFLKRTRVPVLVIFLLFFVFVLAYDIPVIYFSYSGILFEIAGFWCVLGLSTFVFLNRRFIHAVSDMSFAIYLIHLPIVGFVFLAFGSFLPGKILSPFIVLAAAAGILYLGRLLARKCRMEEAYCILFGIRLTHRAEEKKKL